MRVLEVRDDRNLTRPNAGKAVGDLDWRVGDIAERTLHAGLADTVAFYRR